MKSITSCIVSTLCIATSAMPAHALFGASFEKNYIEAAQEPGAVIFNPPENWHLADPQALPPSVKIMVVGQSGSDFPPSINLGTEKFGGSLKDYLKTIKAINDSQGSEWKDLGTIRTQAGTASLSQVDAKTEWGEVRMMHVILLRDGMAYILTAAALKDEFSKFYKDFFKSMRSLRFNKDVYEAITDPEHKAKLLSRNESLKSSWEQLIKKQQDLNQTMPIEAVAQKVFNSEEFQTNFWKPYKEQLSKEFQEFGPSWEKQLLDQVQSELMTTVSS